MFKKIVISSLIIAFLAMAGGGFYWWQASQPVADLNKSLPSGVKVVKSLFRRDYTVVNKIDGYEFKVPKAWGGIKEMAYVPKENVTGIETTGIGVEGQKGNARLLSIDVYFITQPKFDLAEQAQKIWDFFGFTEALENGSIGSFEVLKAREDVYLGGTYVYFFGKGNKMYVLNNGSEEFIQEIILNGKW